MKQVNFLFFNVCFLLIVCQNNLEAQNELIPRKSTNGKYGFIDKSESFIISPKFDKAFSFKNGQAKIITNGKWGLINKNGEYIVKPKLSYIGWSNDGYYQWNKNNLSLSNNLIPPKNIFYHDENGFLAYLKDEHWGLISTSGRLLKNEWDSLEYGKGGHFAVYKKGKAWTWIDINNKAPKDLYYDEVIPLSNALIASKNRSESAYKLFNFEGTKQSDSVYRSLESLNSEYIKVKNQRLWYQLDSRANPIVENGYEEIRYVKGNNTMQYLPSSPWIESDADFNINKNLNFEIKNELADNLFIIEEGTNYFIWNCNALKKFKISADDSVVFSKPYLKIYHSNSPQFKLLSTTLNVLSEDILDFKTINESNLIRYKTKIDQWILWDLTANSAILSNIDSNYLKFSENEIKLSRNGKIGIFDLFVKKWILDPVYIDVIRINDTLNCSLDSDSIKFYGKKGFINSNGQFDSVIPVNDSVMALKNKSDKWTLRNLNLKKIINDEFQSISINGPFSIILKKQNGWILYNSANWERILSNSYDSISPIQNGYYVIHKNSKLGIIDTYGNFTFQLSYYYNELYFYDTKRWQVYRNGLSGIVDQNGVLKISTQYENFDRPMFNYIPFKFRSKWGLLDQKERFILQPLNDSLDVLSENFVQVWKNQLTGIKNLNDKTLIPIEFQAIIPTKFGSFIVKKSGKYGFYDENAQQIRPVSYDEIKQLDVDLIALKKNDYWQLINLKGELVIDKKFTAIYKGNDRLFYKEKKAWIMKSLD